MDSTLDVLELGRVRGLNTVLEQKNDQKSVRRSQFNKVPKSRCASRSENSKSWCRQRLCLSGVSGVCAEAAPEFQNHIQTHDANHHEPGIPETQKIKRDQRLKVTATQTTASWWRHHQIPHNSLHASMQRFENFSSPLSVSSWHMEFLGKWPLCYSR